MRAGVEGVTFKRFQRSMAKQKKVLKIDGLMTQVEGKSFIDNLPVRIRIMIVMTR